MLLNVFKSKARRLWEKVNKIEQQEEKEYQAVMAEKAEVQKAKDREDFTAFCMNIIDSDPSITGVTRFQEQGLKNIHNGTITFAEIKDLMKDKDFEEGRKEVVYEISKRIGLRRAEGQDKEAADSKVKREKIMRIKYTTMVVCSFLLILGFTFAAGMYVGAKKAGWKLTPPTASAVDNPAIPGTPQVDTDKPVSTDVPSDPVVVIPAKEELKSPVDLPWWLHYGGTENDLKVKSIDTATSHDFPDGITTVVVTNAERGLLFTVKIVRGEIYRISYAKYIP